MKFKDIKPGVKVIIIVALIVLFIVFVWPTRYWYYCTLDYGESCQPVRVDRFSGRIDISTTTGWERVNETPDRQ